jgi:acetylornithine deacetylase/succinyl-diaminopimelate desuccinylase-like protein
MDPANHPRREPLEERSPFDLPGVSESRARLKELDPWVLETQVELTAIPAPPFGEGPRGGRMGELFEQVGLAQVRKDEVGNILAELPGHREQAEVAGPAATDPPPESPHPGVPPPFMISAHLDTVFPPGTDVSPQRSGEIIRAPGIADDGRGLATLLALGRVLTEVKTPLPFPLLFAATVGEEGMGDLRGVRHLFRKDGPGQGALGFISLDGVGLERVITRGVGSTRLRITLRGPGGHSWADWGLPNPIHQLGRVVSSMGGLPTPDDPRTTATAAKWGGGKSINAIPQEAWVEFDLRSEGPDELSALEAALLRECERVLTRPGQNKEKSSPRLELELQELGRRPAGRTAESSPLVNAAVRATELLGVEPRLTSASTDANIPMSLGIPAITLGAGGEAGGIHTLDEWYSNQKGPEGILRAFLTLVLLR